VDVDHQLILPWTQIKHFGKNGMHLTREDTKDYLENWFTRCIHGSIFPSLLTLSTIYEKHLDTVYRIKKLGIVSIKTPFVYVCGNLVTWRKSKKLGVVAISSAEFEFRATVKGVCEDIWIHRVLKELRMTVELPLMFFCNNKAVISMALNLVQHDRTKNIEIEIMYSLL
jgi:hypothetical protein